MATSNRKQVTCPYPTFSSPFMAQEDGKTLLKEEREAFLKVFQEADVLAQDTSDNDPFPAYLDAIDTNLAPFCPTSANRVLLTLKMANVSEKDTVLDLGSGDGRFCTAAVSVYNAARAVGIESDSELVSLSRTLCQRVLGSTRSSAVEFVEGDLLALPSLVRHQEWSVIVLFLLPDHTDKFADVLRFHYQRGARIVSLVFNLDEISELRLELADVSQGIYVYQKQA